MKTSKKDTKRTIEWRNIGFCAYGIFLAVATVALGYMLRDNKVALSGVLIGSAVIMAVTFKAEKDISQLRIDVEVANANLKSLKDLKTESKKNLMLEKAGLRDEIGYEYKRANELRLEIFLKLSMREMTGEEAYKIMEALFSQNLGDLQETMHSLLSGEKEISYMEEITINGQTIRFGCPVGTQQEAPIETSETAKKNDMHEITASVNPEMHDEG